MALLDLRNTRISHLTDGSTLKGGGSVELSSKKLIQSLVRANFHSVSECCCKQKHKQKHQSQESLLTALCALGTHINHGVGVGHHGNQQIE